MIKDFQYSLNDLNTAADLISSTAGNQRIWTFSGDLGAGKTTLIQALAAKTGSADKVTSPTYTIVNEYVYPGGKIYHIDAYRLKDEQEAFEAGIEEILHSGELVWIEWPEKISNLLPESYLAITIEIFPDYRLLKLKKQRHGDHHRKD